MDIDAFMTAVQGNYEPYATSILPAGSSTPPTIHLFQHARGQKDDQGLVLTGGDTSLFMPCNVMGNLRIRAVRWRFVLDGAACSESEAASFFGSVAWARAYWSWDLGGAVSIDGRHLGSWSCGPFAIEGSVEFSPELLLRADGSLLWAVAIHFPEQITLPARLLGTFYLTSAWEAAEGSMEVGADEFEMDPEHTAPR